MKQRAGEQPLRFRSIFISDVHLGTRECRAEFLLDFLRATECDQLYLVGDIVDLWAMRRSVHWRGPHGEVVNALLAKARGGTRVIYIPGNHDEALRAYAGMRFENIDIALEAIHLTADQRRFLVVHGDEFDGAVQCGRWLSLLGSTAYDLVLRLSHQLHALRHRFGLSYWSLAAFLKRNIGNATRYIEKFDEAVVHEASRRGVDGLICGHIHRAQMLSGSGAVYCNTGDWVESCTALVERHDGTLELLHWSDRQHSVVQLIPRDPPLPAAA